MEPVMRLYSGREVNPLNIQINEIDIRDIAHGLALCNRFAGQTRKPISVAQHCVFACRMCAGDKINPDWLIAARQALLHDAAEAYLGDMTKWLKQSPGMSVFRAAEDRLQELIYSYFGLPMKMLPEVEEVDRILVRFEGTHKNGFGPDFVIKNPRYPSLTEEEKHRVGKWGSWTWRTAEEVFLIEYRLHFETITAQRF